MRICFFTRHEIDWGSSRERIGVYLDYVGKRGHTYKIIYCIPNRLSRIWIGDKGRYFPFTAIYSFWHSRILKHLKFIWVIITAKKFDVIVIQKVNLLYPLVGLLRLRIKNIIFDFDDLCFWDLESTQKAKIGFVKRWNFFRKGLQHPKVLRLYGRVIAGNKYLAQLSTAIRAAEGTTIIPTPIDCRLYHPQKKNSEDTTIIIGWAGSGENHLRHLELLISPLKELVKQYDVVFKLIGAMHSKRVKAPFEFLDSYFNCIDWVDYNQLPNLIRTFDIGVMPLRDDDESRGKCGFKALQYMASGISVVISPVGINKDIVKDGINGFLAKDTSEWIRKLSILIEDKSLRNEFAEKGRETVEEFYSLEKTSEAFLETLEKFKK